MKKKLITLLTIILIISISLLVYLLLIKDKKEKIIYTDASLDSNINLEKDLTLEYGKLGYLNKYIKNIDFLKIENKEIKYDKLGEIKVKFSYKNNKENKTEYRYITITVVDTTKPYISIPLYKTILVNTEPTFVEDFFVADNHDKHTTRYLEGDYDLSTPGVYNVLFVAEDISGNKDEKNMTLNVVTELPETKKEPTNKQINYIDYSELYSKYKDTNTKVGIDVSRWQGDIDFDLLKQNNVEFIMIRLGGQDGLDGDYYIDSKFKQNIEGALSHGFDVGVYFYSYAYTKEEAIKQAKYVVKNIKEYKITMPVVFDWEAWNKFPKLNVSLYDLTKVQEEFLNYVTKKGYIGSRYGSKNYLNNAWQESKYPTWLAHYVSETSYDKEYYMWQRCDTGKIPGINGAVDVDILYLDKLNINNNK